MVVTTAAKQPVGVSKTSIINILLTYFAQSVSTVTGLMLKHTAYTHFLDGAFTLLVYCIFYDMYSIFTPLRFLA